MFEMRYLAMLLISHHLLDFVAQFSPRDAAMLARSWES